MKMLSSKDYLRYVINHSNLYTKKNWYYKAFSIILSTVEASEPYDLSFKNNKCYALINDKEEEIIDYTKDHALFSFQEQISIDNTFFPDIKNEILTTVGRILFNKLVFYDVVGEKLGYLNESFTTSKVEEILANKVKNKEELTSNDISVEEMIQIINRLNFLTQLASIVNIASTRKTITAPPGIKEIKQKLLEEYKDQLKDPVKVVELEKKLEAVDNAYLADDPAASKIFNKKSKNARKKLYLMFGSTLDFGKTTANEPIIPSLNEGVQTDPNVFPKYINDLRLGSFSRGAFTQLSGYSYKILQRSISNISIDPKPCDTTKAVSRVITKDNYFKLANRYIKVNNNWVLVESKEKAKDYIGKEVLIRSSMYCTHPGNKICYQCASEIYKEMPNGTTNIASQLSAVLMSMFLKLMHGSETQSTKIKLDDLIT